MLGVGFRVLGRGSCHVAQLSPVTRCCVAVFSCHDSIYAGSASVELIEPPVLLVAQRSRQVAGFSGTVTKLCRMVTDIRSRDQIAQLLCFPLQVRAELSNRRVALFRGSLTFIARGLAFACR